MGNAFSVQPEDLRGFGGLVDRASEDFAEAASYTAKNTQLDFSCAEDLWSLVFGDHKARVQESKDILNKFQRILDASQGEVKKSASYYQQTDQSEARRVDSTYPSDGKSIGKGRGVAEQPGTFRDVTDARSQLKSTGGSDGWLQGHASEFSFAPANKTLGTLLDFGSPSALANEGLKLAFDVDILGQVTNWLAGDWQGYAECADAWANLGNFCAGVARNIRNGNAVLASGWNGNAADSAQTYFGSLADKLEKAKESYDSLHDHYVEIARAVFSFGEFVKGAVVQLLDLAVQAMVAAAASTAAAASGVGIGGALVGGAIVAERVLAMTNKYAEIVKRYEQVMTVLNGMVGAGGVVLAKTSQDVQAFPVVGGSYDNKVA
jgi:hypothetical protein